MRTYTYERNGNHWFAYRDGCTYMVLALGFTASLGVGGVKLTLGAHSVVFPVSWLDGNPARVKKALASIGGEPSVGYGGTHLLACIKSQL